MEVVLIYTWPLLEDIIYKVHFTHLWGEPWEVAYQAWACSIQILISKEVKSVRCLYKNIRDNKLLVKSSLKTLKPLTKK